MVSKKNNSFAAHFTPISDVNAGSNTRRRLLFLLEIRHLA